MRIPTILAAAARGHGLLIGCLCLLAALAGGVPAKAGTVTLTANFSISVGGITIGRADAKAQFMDDGGYVAAINGSTYGLTRLVADAHAVVAAAGHIVGRSVAPSSYSLATNEDGYATHVRMRLSNSSVVKLDAEPQPRPAPDLVPVTDAHKKNVMDPLGAFVFVLSNPADFGQGTCNRTLSIFDGWQRFDIKLSYKETKNFVGFGKGAYSGKVIACTARYVPIAGHRTSQMDSAFLAANRRLEVWLAPIAGTNLVVPIHVLISTQIGDLVLRARSFVVSAAEQPVTPAG